MKVLLDENVPTDFYRHLPGHDVFTVKFMGWLSLKNGYLLEHAVEQGFDAMLTLDQNMAFQQSTRRIRFPILIARIERDQDELEQMIALAPDLLRVLATKPPPGFHHVYRLPL